MRQRLGTVYLLIEDETVRNSLGDLLESYQFEVVLNALFPEIVRNSVAEAETCLVVDLPDRDGKSSEILSALISRPVNMAPLVLLTGRCDRSLRQDVDAVHPECHLEKPVDSEWLVATINGLLRRQRPISVTGQRGTSDPAQVAFG